MLSLRESDFSPLPADHFTEVTIPLYYEGHAYRAGSRIRVTIAAPGGTQPIWAFAQTQPDEGGAEVAIAYGEDMPSHLLLPVVPGVEVPTALPPCPGLRGEPCRDYAPFANRSADLQPTADGGSPRRKAAAPLRSKANNRRRAARCRLSPPPQAQSCKAAGMLPGAASATASGTTATAITGVAGAVAITSAPGADSLGAAAAR